MALLSLSVFDDWLYTTMTIAAIRRTVYVGTFIHSASLTELEVLENAAVVVDNETGRILAVEKDVTGEMTGVWEGEAGTRVVKVGEGQFFFPGFIGTSSRSLYQEARF